MKKPLLFIISSFILFKSYSQVTATSINLFTYPMPGSDIRALQDGVAVFFNTQSDTVDLFDIKKITNPLENIAILRNNVLLAGEQRTTFDTIPLTLWNLTTRDYELEIFLRNINEAYLEDVIAGTKNYFTSADTLRYKFTNNTLLSPKDSSVRFRLIFGKPPVRDNDDDKGCDRRHSKHDNRRKNIKLYPNPVKGDYVNIDMKDLPAGRYKISIVAPHYRSSFIVQHTENSLERINTSKLPKGRYYVVIQDGRWKDVKQIEVD
jgi:hypothetical protein